MPHQVSAASRSPSAGHSHSTPTSSGGNGTTNSSQLQQFDDSSPRSGPWSAYALETSNAANIDAVLDDIKQKFGI
ncbi:hypothetical protein MaudMau93_000363 [Microsporum audouinii]